jgi:hypothetical protein
MLYLWFAIKKGEELKLPDGRYLCARDAKTVVLKTDEAEQIWVFNHLTHMETTRHDF